MGQIVTVQSESVGNIYAGYRFRNMLTDIIDSMAYMVGIILPCLMACMVLVNSVITSILIVSSCFSDMAESILRINRSLNV